jgi:hypothetical protein
MKMPSFEVTENERIGTGQGHVQAAAVTLPAAQQRSRGGLDVDHARLLVLGGALPDLGMLALDPDDARRPAHGDGPAIQVDISPAQRQQFTAAHPGVGQDVPGDVVRAVAG